MVGGGTKDIGRINKKMNLFVRYFIVIGIMFSNIIFAQNIEQPKECPYTSIQRIVIKNDSISSFFTLDSLELLIMKEFRNKSSIDSIENILSRHDNRKFLNNKLYLCYVFLKKNGQYSFYFSNYPLMTFDALFVLNSMVYSGKKEDESFSLDFWTKNLKNEKTKPYNYHKKER